MAGEPAMPLSIYSYPNPVPDLQFPVKCNGIQSKILQTKYRIHIEWWPRNSVGQILHNYSNTTWFNWPYSYQLYITKASYVEITGDIVINADLMDFLATYKKAFSINKVGMNAAFNSWSKFRL